MSMVPEEEALDGVAQCSSRGATFLFLFLRALLDLVVVVLVLTSSSPPSGKVVRLQQLLLQSNGRARSPSSPPGACCTTVPETVIDRDRLMAIALVRTMN